MRFLLLRAPEEKNVTEIYSFYSPKIYPPLGLMSIGASLEHEGHKVEIIDLCMENNSEEHLRNSLNTSDAVGVSVYSNDYNFVGDLLNKIKDLDSDIPIIIGGPHCTFFLDHSLSHIPHADISVIGEGENVIVDISRYLQGKKNLSDIHGIYYRENKKIKKGKPLKVINDLDSLHFPARHLTEKYDYGMIENLHLFKPKFTSMMSSRGCPFNCRFCARYGNFIKGWGFRQRSAESVIKEITEIDKKYGSVMISDDCFLADKKRSHKIMDKLIEIGTNVELIIEGARVDSADREIYKKMKKANVKLVGYGIESGNQDVLDFYNKNVTLDQIKAAVNLGHEMGFITMATFIFGAPMETEKHIKNTKDFAFSLPLDIAIFSPLYYQYGSQLWDESIKNKVDTKDKYIIIADKHNGLGKLSAEELNKYTEESSKQFYLRPSYILGQIYRAFLRRDFRMLKNGLRVITSFRTETES